jgi:alanine-synthesizing transaminase
VSRLDFTLRETALARAVADRGPVIDLTASNPTTVGLPAPDATLPAAAVYAPDPRGLLGARAAIGRYHGVAPEQVLLTASTSEAYSWLLKLLCDPGDEVLVPQPSYPLFDDLIALEGVRAVPYPLRWDGEWHLDAAALPVGARTRAVLAVSPGNPAGAYLKAEELSALARTGLPLVCDEVFADFPAAPDPRRVRSAAAQAEALTFSLSGLSKVCGLPQLKLGWIVAGGPGAEEELRRLELIADTYLSVSTPVQLAAPELLAARHGFQQALNSRLAQNRRTLQEARGPHAPWDVLRSEGGWSAVLSVPRSRSEEQWALALLEAGVLVHPGYFFDFPSGAQLVVSLLPEPAEFARGAALLAATLEGR